MLNTTLLIWSVEGFAPKSPTLFPQNCLFVRGAGTPLIRSLFLLTKTGTFRSKKNLSKNAPIKQTKMAKHGRLVNILKGSKMVRLDAFHHLGPF